MRQPATVSNVKKKRGVFCTPGPPRPPPPAPRTLASH
eukprot:COSAG04_NODE_27272_length_285_cov_0.494624_1_plen_36_part_01